MAIINVKVSSVAARKTIQLDSGDTIKKAFDEVGITTEGDLSLSLGGQVIKTNELNKKFDEFTHLNLDSTIVLSAIVNSKNA